MSLWRIDDTRIRQDVKKLKGDANVLRQLDVFKEEVESLDPTVDPKYLGGQKVEPKFENCLVKTLTKSYRLVFRIDYSKRYN